MLTRARRPWEDERGVIPFERWYPLRHVVPMPSTCTEDCELYGGYVIKEIAYRLWHVTADGAILSLLLEDRPREQRRVEAWGRAVHRRAAP